MKPRSHIQQHFEAENCYFSLCAPDKKPRKTLFDSHDRLKAAYIRDIEAKLCNEFEKITRNIDPINERQLIGERKY